MEVEPAVFSRGGRGSVGWDLISSDLIQPRERDFELSSGDERSPMNSGEAVSAIPGREIGKLSFCLSSAAAPSHSFKTTPFYSSSSSSSIRIFNSINEADFRSITSKMEEKQPPEIHLNGVVPPSMTSTENASTKRQRRPSVRLGDIGDQAYDNRRAKHCKPPIKDSGKGLRTRPVVNLSGGSGAVAGVEYHETLEGDDKEGNLESVAIGSWKVRDSKSRRGGGGGSAKRIRSNWMLKTEEGGGGGDGDEKISGGGDGDEDMDDERFRDFNAEDSDSRLKEHSPINSLDNNNNNTAIDAVTDRGGGGGGGGRRRVVVRGRDSHEEGVDMDGGPSDNDGRNWNQEVEERNGVKVWLNQLGLGRYAPVFEIHEVDDEVLPLLTLEDLKDMGINAVGSRRKMFCSIQKLNRGFS